MPNKIDNIDAKILYEIQKDAALSVADIADKGRLVIIAVLAAD